MERSNYTHARTCVYNINYHIIWCVKYRKKVLTPEVAKYLKSVLQDVANENGFIISAMEVGEADHIHVFVSAPPKLSITFIVKHLKGTSGIRMFKRYPELRNQLWKGQLWNGSYFVETIGSTSEENIRKYIERQNTAQH